MPKIENWSIKQTFTSRQYPLKRQNHDRLTGLQRGELCNFVKIRILLLRYSIIKLLVCSADGFESVNFLSRP